MGLAMMSVHDALEAWQAGEITSGRARQMTGAADVMELRAFAEQSGLPVRVQLLPREEEQAACATALIERLMENEVREATRSPDRAVVAE